MFTPSIAERGWSGLKIGFVFFGSASRFIVIISFHKRRCAYFGPAQIGFVFSNRLRIKTKKWSITADFADYAEEKKKS